MGRRPEWTFFQGRHTESQLAHEKIFITNYSVQFSSVAQSCPTLCHPMNRSMPGLPVHHKLPEFTQTHVHRVSDAIQPSHPLSSPSPQLYFKLKKEKKKFPTYISNNMKLTEEGIYGLT